MAKAKTVCKPRKTTKDNIPEVIAYCLPIDVGPEVRHYTYWTDVQLGGRLILAILCLPLFFLGMGVSIYRRIRDRITNAR